MSFLSKIFKNNEQLKKKQPENERWPLPEFDNNEQPHFLFIITPPYSGSTALTKLINTSDKTTILQSRGEGQWLVPGLCEKDRWKEEKKVNYESVKAVWLNKYQKQKRANENISVVIEKSPPNMMRIEKLSAQFKDFSFIANNRNPYANCASMLYRLHDGGNLDTMQRKKILTDLAQGWLTRSLKIKELVSKLSIPLLTYEEFCCKPSAILEILNLPNEALNTIDTSASVKVKDYDKQPIINQNKRQISNLNEEEIKLISKIIRTESELLRFFTYECL